MAKFSSMNHGDRKGYSYQCPACGCAHMILTDGNGSPNWSFNGDVDSPTVSPSVKVTTGPQGDRGICHFFIKNGMIEYCSDCTHDKAGHVVEIPEWQGGV